MEKNSKTYTWYATLKKPTWAPPSWIFGPVWILLYILIAISFGTVFYSIVTGALPFFVVVPFALNLLFNVAFTPIQFGLRNNLLASIDIVLILSTLVWFMIVIYPLIAWVALVNIPYFLWVSFATVLQLTITCINYKK